MHMINNQMSNFQAIPLYSKNYGAAYVGDSLQLMQLLPDASVNLVLTSPPFALTSKKEYGNKDADEYLNWFLPFAWEIKRVLAEDGSFVIDLGGAYLPGHPVRSIYQYELLISLVKKVDFFLAQEFFHYNPARLPAPAEWVNVRRIRVKDSVNLVWWLSKTEYPKANNRNVLRPYTEAMKRLLERGYRAKKRPSGHDITHKFNKDNNGAIPPNLLELGNNDSNSTYMKRCQEYGIKPHPARFPKKFPEFFIKFLTNENDLVLDPFAGSNTTGYVAENLQRRWLAFELEENYLHASSYRFEEPFEEKDVVADNENGLDSNEERDGQEIQLELFTHLSRNGSAK